MDFYLKADKWNDRKCPKESKVAEPAKWRTVQDATVIKVTNAKYRKAEFDGYFLVVNGNSIKEGKLGKGKKKVFCLWFGHQIKTDFPELTIDIATTELIENYKGKVVIDLADPKKK